MLRPACWIFLAAIPVWAGDVRVNVQFTPAAPTLSDTIWMEVSVTGSEGSDLFIGAADVASDCVRIQSVSGTGLRQVLTLDPLKPGACTIPPFRTRCLHGRTDSCDVRSAATVIPIGTMVADPAHADIRDQEEMPVLLPEAPRERDWWRVTLWIGAAMLAVAGGYAAIRKWIASRNKPEKRARRRLKELAGGEISAEAFSQLTYILRGYLEERAAFGAGQCTSPELMEALRERSLGQGSTAAILTELLASCDRARFAGRPVTALEFEKAAEDCDTVIQCLDFDIERRSRAGV